MCKQTNILQMVNWKFWVLSSAQDQALASFSASLNHNPFPIHTRRIPIVPFYLLHRVQYCQVYHAELRLLYLPILYCPLRKPKRKNTRTLLCTSTSTLIAESAPTRHACITGLMPSASQILGSAFLLRRYLMTCVFQFRAAIQIAVQPCCVVAFISAPLQEELVLWMTSPTIDYSYSCSSTSSTSILP